MQFQSETGMNWPQLIDENIADSKSRTQNRLFKFYGLTSVPGSVVIDADGTVKEVNGWDFIKTVRKLMNVD
jgi:hypothetical protein